MRAKNVFLVLISSLLVVGLIAQAGAKSDEVYNGPPPANFKSIDKNYAVEKPDWDNEKQYRVEEEWNETDRSIASERKKHQRNPSSTKKKVKVKYWHYGPKY